jgi:hypothetical protein
MNALRITVRSLVVLAGLGALAAAPASAVFFHIGNGSIDGSLCVGNDCISSESFGFDTIRVKENNLRFHFDDTSTSASFPPNDWRLIANDSANGGASHFTIEDATAGRNVFRVFAGARSNALVVDSQGDVGIGTSTPATDIDIKIGDTPTLRLQQDGTSGFTPQTWDVAGNETNFFVRDATGGSQLPFRIRSGAPSDSVYIADDGDIGMGTAAPEQQLHVRRTTADPVIALFESTNSGAVQIRMETDSTNRRFLARDGSGNNESQIVFGDNGAFDFLGPTASDVRLQIDSSGNLFIQGACSEGGSPGSGSCADYVFEPEYELLSIQQLREFIAENKHLPNVPSADEIRKEGLNIQHFQGRLLEKVEELTLYILSQEERLGELNRENSALRSDIEKMRISVKGLHDALRVAQE